MVRLYTFILMHILQAAEDVNMGCDYIYLFNARGQPPAMLKASS